MNKTHAVAYILAMVGAVNWGLVGLGKFFGGNWDLVDLLVGSWSMVVANIVYVLVGVSAVYLVVTHKKTCKECEAKPQM